MGLTGLKSVSLLESLRENLFFIFCNFYSVGCSHSLDCGCITLASASVISSPSLTLTLLPPSDMDVYNCTALTQIIQGNFPILTSLT